jgi:hypothetical protein
VSNHQTWSTVSLTQYIYIYIYIYIIVNAENAWVRALRSESALRWRLVRGIQIVG